MIAYRDSSFQRPNAAQAASAYAAGVRAWGGYLATVSPVLVNLATAWTQADFDVLRAGGIAPIAFCSGWDNASACGAQARSWGVRLMLDVEDGIRADGSWVDAWLAQSGAGLYGGCTVHAHRAPAHIVARYPGGDPRATWDPTCPTPSGLLGWQSQGTHADPVTGLSVDSGWLDDGYALHEPAPGPQVADNEEDEMPLIVARPDGGKDYYVRRPNGQCVHYIVDARGKVTWADYPQGTWERLTEAGYWNGTEAYVRGVGVDGHVWQSAWNPGDNGWEPAVLLA